MRVIMPSAEMNERRESGCVERQRKKKGETERERERESE
jgi:hypothetical protein